MFGLFASPVSKKEVTQFIDVISRGLVDSAFRDARFAHDLARSASDDSIANTVALPPPEIVALDYWYFHMHLFSRQLTRIAKQNGDSNLKKLAAPIYSKVAEHCITALSKAASSGTGQSVVSWAKDIEKHRYLTQEAFSTLPLVSEGDTDVKQASVSNWTAANVALTLHLDTDFLAQKTLTAQLAATVENMAPWFDQAATATIHAMKN